MLNQIYEHCDINACLNKKKEKEELATITMIVFDGDDKKDWRMAGKVVLPLAGCSWSRGDHWPSSESWHRTSININTIPAKQVHSKVLIVIFSVELHSRYFSLYKIVFHERQLKYCFVYTSKAFPETAFSCSWFQARISIYGMGV